MLTIDFLHPTLYISPHSIRPEGLVHLRRAILAASDACLLIYIEEIFKPLILYERVGTLQGKTNFFEKRVSEYQKSGVMDSLINQDDRIFKMDEEF